MECRIDVGDRMIGLEELLSSIVMIPSRCAIDSSSTMEYLAPLFRLSSANWFPSRVALQGTYIHPSKIFLLSVQIPVDAK